MQPGVLGVAAQLVGRDQAQPVAADPARGRRALAALLEDRRSGSRSPVAASCWAEPALVTIAPVSGSSRGHSRTIRPSKRARSVGVGQPDVDDGQAARREVVGHRRAAPRAGRPGSAGRAASSGR